MIEIENLNVRAGEFALRDINLHVSENEFFILMGPTGAGKTLLLETIVGLNQSEGGRISINGRVIIDLPPEKRGVGIVYQDCALFPHLDVSRNINYGSRYNGFDRGEEEERFEWLVSELNLKQLLKRFPGKLSGGEKQRVALARALMVKPSILLLDEPFSNLDPRFREEVKKMVKNMHISSKITFIMVTHDFRDAKDLGERGAVINNGRIEHVGRLEEIIESEAMEFISELSP